VLLAMRMNLGLATSVVGSGQQRKQTWFSQELDKKEAVLVSVWLKESY
jgi:hypothetical protein